MIYQNFCKRLSNASSAIYYYIWKQERNQQKMPRKTPAETKLKMKPGTSFTKSAPNLQSAPGIVPGLIFPGENQIPDQKLPQGADFGKEKC